MANRLKMAQVQSIRTLHERGWSRRRIARALGIHRETVGRYVGLAGEGGSEPAKVPTGSESSKPAKVPAGSTGPPAGSRSGCERYRDVILAKLEQGLSAQRIWQDLGVECGFGRGYDSVKRFVRKLRQSSPLPFRRMECAPGEQGQVDFGRGAPIVNDEGRRRGSWVFRVVLGHSRKGYSEAVFRQTTDGFLGCLENAFWAFGGVPRTIVIDNLKAAVKTPDWFDPELNPKVQAFCAHYGTVILPAKPYMARHKGKVERGIGYVRGNALKGRRFASLNEENRHLAEWEASVADTRIHGTTRRQVGKVFRDVEQPALLPLPAGRFGFFHEAQRMVHRDGHVEVARAYYSVPPEYLGHRVWVRWDGRLVRVFTEGMEQIAVHAQHEPGRFSTRPQHIHSRKISSVERGTAWLLRRAGRLGPSAERWGRAMLQARGIPGVRVLVGLLSLTRRYRPEQIDRACQIALTHEAFRLRVIRELIRRGGGRQEEFEYLASHEIIRDPADYGELVTAAFRGEPLLPATLQEEGGS